MAAPKTPAAQGWHGSARLHFTHHQGKTGAQHYAQAPIKLQKPLYPEGDRVCHNVLIHTAGGMVGSDRIHLNADLALESCALITTAAANKIYRSTGATSEQTVSLTLAPETCLEWFPLETIVFSGARFFQKQRVDLAPGAIWAGWDITRFGRSARGETFQQGHWRSHAEVWQNNRPLWLDRQTLSGGSMTLTSRHGLAGQPVIGTLTVFGYTPNDSDLEQLRSLWPASQPGEVGITRLQQGLLCRYRGPSTQAARQGFTTLWGYLRPRYLARPACLSRVWAV
ncbi:MAG TPA: urease accessory protein UreD [Trichocoleus sp.]